MEKIEQQLKDLTLKFEGIVKRIEAILEEIMMAEKRTEEKKKQLDQVLADIEKTREQRQRLLVNGGKVEPTTRKIKEFWESCDLIEDEILGLKGKIKDLHEENDKLLVDKDICQDEIIRTRVAPLLETYNKEAEKLSETLKGIDSIMEEYGLAYAEAKGWGRFISCSNWIALRVIPRLSQPCDQPGEDFWNITQATFKKQQEQREAAYKSSQHTPGSEA